MTSIPQRELERFFAEVGPRLETAQTLDDELDRQLARRFNVFRYLRTDEMGFSRIIADLLDPAGDHGQGTAFLKLLTAKLDFAEKVNLDGARVQTERVIHDRRRVDIVVEIDGKHCLAIENKSNSAVDQESQVEDYLRWLREYSHSLLIYLSPNGEGPSEESVDRKVIDDLADEGAQRFVIMPCGPCVLSDDGNDDFRLPFSLVDWLADCRRDCDVDRLRWYLREIETYCRQQYGGMTVTDSKKNAVADFLRRDSKNLATALAVYVTWPEVARKVRERFFESIKEKICESMEGNYIVGVHGEESYGSYIGTYRMSWRPYVVGDQEERTHVQMWTSSTLLLQVFRDPTLRERRDNGTWRPRFLSRS